MKKLLAILLSALLVFSLVACNGGSNETTAPSGADESQGSTGNDVVKIGVFEPQSGANGAGGKQEILGMQYANHVAPTVEIGGKTYDVQCHYHGKERRVPAYQPDSARRSHFQEASFCQWQRPAGIRASEE